MYSRQSTEINTEGVGPGVDLTMERYLGGIQEEKEIGERSRFFGVFLAGATHFAPRDASSQTLFTASLGLGLKHSVSKHFGVRTEARGFSVATESGGGGVWRNGDCLFVYSASGLWQGDLSAGFTMKF